MRRAGILRLLEPVREREGLVVELGCGSGLLTRHLLDAGHRVIATDASPSMLDLAHGVEATVQASFGDETFPIGLHAIFGRKSGSE
ncbi:MAG: class I SAM-dependent methyltransferase [Actinomycetota bacterium]|nr:class I SAM-dependent methyltransferase [Actinomycetota bacterium]